MVNTMFSILGNNFSSVEYFFHTGICEDLTLRAIQRPFADSVDQNQALHNVHSDLASTLSDEDNIVSPSPRKYLTNSKKSSLAALTHSHTMTPFDAPGKQAF